MWLLNSAARRGLAALLLSLALGAGLAGCGYGLASDLPTVLGSSASTLRLGTVEQPTLYPWVVYTVRSAMRDEITARNIARWVDSGSADYTMHIKVNSFTMRSSVASSSDETLLYTGSASMTVTIHSSKDNRELWRGSASYSNEFDNETEEAAAKQLFIQAVRRLADNMRNTF